MSNLIFISALFAAVCCGANAHVLSKTPNFPLGIVNGTDAGDGEFPYVVQLYYEDSFICSGAIIDASWILTAGQCATVDVTYVVYGTNVVTDSPPASNIVKVKRTIVHPKYFRNNTLYGNIPVYDIAVLELAEPIQFNDKVQPLKLAESNDVPFHVPGVLAGWGYNASLKLNRQLQKVELPLLNDSECFAEIERNTGADVFNGVHDLCNDQRYGGQCLADTGGPFVINGLGYGVASYFFSSCVIAPGTYSRITNPEYRDFIRNNAGV